MPLPRFHDDAEIRKPRFLESVAPDRTPVKATFRPGEPAAAAKEEPPGEGRAPKIPLPSRWPSLNRERTPGPGGVVIPPSVLGQPPGDEAAGPTTPFVPERQVEPHAPRITEGTSQIHAARLAASVERLRAESERLAELARADALEIGFQVARRILELELTTSAEPLFSLVRSAVRRAGESRTLTLRLHPADKALIDESGGAARVDGLMAARLQIVADPSLSRGDCMVDAEFGSVDGRLDTRFAQVRRSLDSALDEEGG